MLETLIMTGYVLFFAFLFIGIPVLLILGLYLLLARMLNWWPFPANELTDAQ